MSRARARTARVVAVLFVAALVGIQVARVVTNSQESGEPVSVGLAQTALVVVVVLVLAMGLAVVLLLPSARRVKALGSSGPGVQLYSLWRTADLSRAIARLSPVTAETGSTETPGFEPFLTLAIHGQRATIWSGDRQPFKKLLTISHPSAADITFGEWRATWGAYETLRIEVPAGSDGRESVELLVARGGFRALQLVARPELERLARELVVKP